MARNHRTCGGRPTGAQQERFLRALNEPGAGQRGCLSWFFLGMWFGVMWKLATRPGTTMGCGCLIVLIFIGIPAFFYVAFLIAYTWQTVLVTMVIFALWAGLKGRSAAAQDA